MTDVVGFFETKIDEANVSLKCGRCWEFHYGRKDYTNLIRKNSTDDCCNYFLLEWFKVKQIKEFDKDFGTSELSHDLISFRAFCGVDSDFTRQMYSEVDKNDIEGSKWNVYMKPLMECLEGLLDDKFCSTIFPAGFLDISYEPKYNYKDQTLDGFEIVGMIRKDYK
ncbi:hypothetical protein [Aquimarina algiphila]|uniref:Uncharacterized protein n=1 Tax=Aquimarina algiphila TaxID=2047982 RepID=A0A554VE37_9FLAO|nr:hypothetical protein [Aquimarina algiphila]TSE05244.1 hypothetical protein FOF46_23560 [Aquimarina algiphila]